MITIHNVPGEPLDCFQFRSWAPGEPRAKRENEDCVVLDSRQAWRVVSCQTKLPFICELLPNGSSVYEHNNTTNRTGTDTNFDSDWKNGIFSKLFEIIFS